MGGARARSTGVRRRATETRPAGGHVFEAEIASVTGDGRAQVRRRGGPSALVPCEVAVLGYAARAGDRVLVTLAPEGASGWITGVLQAERRTDSVHAIDTPPGLDEATRAGDTGPRRALDAPSGATAAVEGEAIVVRDPAGAIVARYDAGRSTLRIGEGLARVEIGSANGTVTIAARDIELNAESGTVAVAARDIALAAPEGKVAIAGREVDIHASTRATVSAEDMEHTAGRWEVGVGRLIERASEAYREAELTETRGDRVRTLAKTAFDVVAGRTTLLSDDDTVIDGKRVLLG